MKTSSHRLQTIGRWFLGALIHINRWVQHLPAQPVSRICERSKRQGLFCRSMRAQPLPISGQRQRRWRMSADLISWLPLAAKLIVTAAIVVAASVIAERVGALTGALRSEEHTSELQS